MPLCHDDLPTFQSPVSIVKGIFGELQSLKLLSDDVLPLLSEVWDYYGVMTWEGLWNMGPQVGSDIRDDITFVLHQEGVISHWLIDNIPLEHFLSSMDEILQELLALVSVSFHTHIQLANYIQH